MPHLLQVVGDGLPGGGTTVVLQLSERLAARGAEVTVASQSGSYLLQQAARLGLRTLPLDFSRRRTTAAVTRALWRHALAHEGTAIHAHGARAGLPVALLSSRAVLARYYTVHGFHYGSKPAVVRHLAMAVERFCMARADATVFVSTHDRETAVKVRLLPSGAPMHVIPNGADHAEPSIEEPEFDIAFLGRLHRQKNPLILPQILTALRPLRPSLCIIGAGALESSLREAAAAAGVAEQMTFLGGLGHADALAVLGRVRVMLLPSLWEGLPVSVLEAMHRGIPVVASAVHGTEELVADGDTGFLVPVADVSAYADRVRRLLTDDELRARIGARALARARAAFSTEGQVAAHIALYARAALRVQHKAC
jgi:glycosyltransferase involved in cell wall biosynthesis